MQIVRRAWLWSIAGAIAFAGASALLVRFELLDPAPRLSPALYGDALAVHGLLAFGAVLAIVLAIPHLVAAPGSRLLGVLSLASWLAAMLGGLAAWPRFVVAAAAASTALAAAQIVRALLVRSDTTAPRSRALSICALVALAIVATALGRGRLPASFELVLATTALACGAIDEAVRRHALAVALVAGVPTIVTAWAATAILRSIDDVYLHDTVAMLAPLPAIGAALVGVLLVVVRPPRRRLALAAMSLIAGGACAASIAFFVLGTRGLPRRYIAYTVEFQSLQIVVAAAATVTAIGAILAIVAFRPSRPSTCPRRACA